MATCDSLTATLDYTMAGLDLTHTGNSVGTYYGQIREEGSWTAMDNVASPLICSFPSADFVMGTFEDASLNERESFGFNLQWDATDRLSLSLDVHESTAKSSPSGRYGSYAQVAMSVYGREIASTDFTNEVLSSAYSWQSLCLLTICIYRAVNSRTTGLT